MTESLKADSTAFVVGGSTGIGRGIADALLADGRKVVIFSRSRPEGLESSSRLVWAPMDLTQPEESRDQLAEAVGRHGATLDAVFYSAIHYGAGRAPFLSVTELEWRRQLDVNLHGLWLTLQGTLPALSRRSPALFVGISSEVVYNAGPERSGYAATKAAASSLLQSIAEESAEPAVRIVQLLPSGMVDTAGIRRRRPDGFDYSSYMQPSSFGRIAVELVRSRGEGLHGQSLVVTAEGEAEPVSLAPPVSQSRRSA